MKFQTFFAYDPEDSDETRVEKFAIFLVASACCIAGVFWSAMYLVIFGWGLTAFLPALFVVIVGASLAISHHTKNHYYAVYAQIMCIIYITAFIQWSIGDVFDSGFVLVWSFLGPVVALMFFSLRYSAFWFLLYLTNLVITVVFNDFFASRGQTVPESTQMFFFLMNLGIASIVVFTFAGYFVSRALKERERANKLLLNVLPKQIASMLKTGGQTIADHYESVSVLFADIVGSTPLFSDLEPAEAVDWLNEIFSIFDSLAEKYGLEKISTIGDSYLAAAGVPVPRQDHAQAAARLALDMVRELEEHPGRNGQQLAFRLGIHSGPLVAGVIGKSKFHYDIWGDTVNIASRMESHGESGKVQISEATYELVKDSFECVPRGPVQIKGKGEMQTWYLVAEKEPLQV
jgi:adenylate cyclase